MVNNERGLINNTHLFKTAIRTVNLLPQTVPTTRPITRAQHRLQNITQTHTNSEQSTSSDETDSSASSMEHLGVTDETATRRNRIFNAFNKKGRITDGCTTVTIALNWIQKKSWRPSTKQSNFGTLIKMIDLKNIRIEGDRKGAARQLLLNTIRHQPVRVAPLDLETVIKLAAKADDQHKALIYLTWAFAARLTSITKLTRPQLHLQQFNKQFTLATATFREGKTIAATGAYTIKGLIPTESANWITSRPARIFENSIDQYYSRLKSILKPFKVRSLRRGAIQHLSRQRFAPEEIMLLSRHKTIQSLYAYLEDGREAHWEHDKTLTMNASLWKGS